jgi:hypothetical protein
MLDLEGCGNCRFYMSAAKVCRRNPPTPLMVGVKRGISQITGDEPLVQAYFPPMMPNGWCGEHIFYEDSGMENINVAGTS